QRLSLKKWHWLLDIGECRTSQLNSGVINVETWISVENNMNKAVSNAYFIGDSNIDKKYDLPFKMFMNNVAQVLNYTAS
ncbi:hypothetical protein, partial [Vibrio vulnificus]|uniref:hypothetical protein n=1 Tax=Vibrio vulnificus TaxID=672 RepID=UPI003241FFDF